MTDSQNTLHALSGDSCPEISPGVRGWGWPVCPMVLLLVIPAPLPPGQVTALNRVSIPLLGQGALLVMFGCVASSFVWPESV